MSYDYVLNFLDQEELLSVNLIIQNHQNMIAT